MPERAHRRFFSVKTSGEAVPVDYPSEEILAELADSRHRLFETNANVLNNFHGNLPGGYKRIEYTPQDILKEYKKEHPEGYVEETKFFSDVDDALNEAGLDIEYIKSVQDELCTFDDTVAERELYLRSGKVQRELHKYVFPAYEILRLKYGYSEVDLIR